MIDILIQDFKFECTNSLNKVDFKETVNHYQELSKSLELFCLCFFSYYQFTLIFYVFKLNALEFDHIIILIGKISTTLGMVLFIIAVTTVLGRLHF